MSPKSLKIMFPGLNIKEIEFAIKHVENPMRSFLTLIIILVWRGQISYSQSLSLQGKNKKDLLSIPSMKYTSKIISTNSDIQSIIASIAVFRTSADELKFSDFISLSVKDRNFFISSRILELIKSSGSAKILTSKQISTPEDLIVHRRGLLFQIKSLFQCGSVFDSGSLISGSNVLHIGKTQIIQLFSNLFQQDFEDSLYSLRSFYSNSCNISLEDSFSKSVEDLVDWFIIKFLFEDCDGLIFQDGISVSVDNDNLLPIEKGLPIKRNKPAEFPNFLEFDPGDDLFLKAAFSQMKDMRKKNKSFISKGLNVKLKN